MILGAQFILYSFRFGMKIYQIHYSASKHKQTLRLAADTPQYLGITDLCRTYDLGSSVHFLSSSFRDENISDTLLSTKHKPKLRLAADNPQS
jgi:hypothetical protein